MRRAPWRRRLAVVLALGSCMPPDQIALDPVPVAPAPAPDVRIALLLDAPTAAIGGSGGVRVTDPEEGLLLVAPGAATLTAVRRGASVVLRGGERDVVRRRLLLAPEVASGTIRLGGRDYRGLLELEAGPGGVRVVNRVDLEAYLVGVVGAEMGPRGPDEYEALKAQAVASRTYALRQQRTAGTRGYDMVADVGSQVYAGLASEQPLAERAVLETRGEILTWGGEPIDAFFSSTCGGETEDGEAAFAGATRPYLRSIADRAPDGSAWCAISPRYRWEESWSMSQLTAVLRRTLPANALPLARATDLTEMRVLDRTATGRIATLELTGRNGRTAVRGQAIRRVLAPVSGGILRSTDFTVRLGRRGGRIERVTIAGRGYGHAVGMCQYGAIGRARAGQDYATILSSYFPGTTLERTY